MSEVGVLTSKSSSIAKLQDQRHGAIFKIEEITQEIINGSLEGGSETHVKLKKQLDMYIQILWRLDRKLNRLIPNV